MDKLLKLYEKRHKAVTVLLNGTKDEQRKLILNERLREIERVIYEIIKLK